MLLKIILSGGAAKDLFVGLDVSVSMTSVCVMDVNGKVAKEAMVGSEPQAIASVLGSLAGNIDGWGWRRVHFRSGYTVASLQQGFRLSASRHGT